MRARTSLYLFACVAAGLAGCGGGGGDGSASNAVQTATAKIDVQWGQRSRAVNAPSSALSAVITLTGAAADGTDVRWTVNRNAAPAAYQATYASPAPARVGPLDLLVQFFAESDGAGSAVATAASRVSLKADGTGISDVSTSGDIKSVQITPGQVVRAGQQKLLLFSSLDASSNVVAISPGSMFTSVVDGQDHLTITDGQMTGVSAGTAMVVVTVDGHPSLPTAVTVSPNVTMTLTPMQATVPINTPQTFVAVVHGTYDTNVLWRVDEGPVGGTVTPAGVYTAPNTRGTYHVIATSDFDKQVEVTATVVVTAGSSEVTIK